MEVSVIVTTYNQARNLELILESLEMQTFRDFEVVVGDDGSSDHTEDVVQTFAARARLPIQFVTQEDKGFRKTKILNEAIRRSSGSYFLFLDGDMIAHPRLIELHLRHRGDKKVLCGYRGVKLEEQITGEILRGDTQFSNGFWWLLWQQLRGRVTHAARALRIENGALRNLLVPARDSLSGCNFSLYREALYEVNGFNEQILEHGFNDYELGHRLKLAGYELVNVSKLCVTYHLHHPTRKTRRAEVAEKIAEVDRSTATVAPLGIVDHTR